MSREGSKKTWEDLKFTAKTNSQYRDSLQQSKKKKKHQTQQLVTKRANTGETGESAFQR